MTRTRLMTIAGAVIALAVVAAAIVAVLQTRDDADRTTLAGALRLAPADTQRFSWTDWAGVRRQVGLDLTASSPASAVQDLLDRGFEEDLTPSSALGSSAVTMHERLGFSPATLDWELFNQGPDAASLAMRASDSLDFDAVAEALRDEGYEEPTDADGYWLSDPTRDEITAQVTPELLLIALDPDRSMIYSSDSGTGIAAAIDAGARAETEVLPEGIVEAAGQPLAASLYTGDQVCNALALARADATDVEAGRSLIEAAGEVNPLTGFAIGAYADGGVRVAMSLATPEQARVNAETRAILATGPAPGQGGDFGERFALDGATVRDDVIVLDLAPVDGAYVLSDLSSGPVLFATC